MVEDGSILNPDFENKKLPTLDLEIWIEDGVILYQFYEKPMGNNVVVQATTAECNNKEINTD